MVEVCAVSPRYVFTMKPGTGGWPVAEAVSKAVVLVEGMYQERAARAFQRGTLEGMQANADLLHDLWTELAPVLGLVYERTVSR